MRAVYNQYADWYAEYLRGPAAEHTRRTTEALGRLLGPGQGRCLDIGCGTAAHTTTVRCLGWQPLGVDVSLGQLRHAWRQLPVTAGDAARLPIRSGSVDAVVATLIHTDVPDWSATVREAARTLRPGGRFAYVGVHPCFVGPFAQREARTLVLHPGYDDRRLTHEGPGIGSGVRPRVGVRHRTLADLLNPLPAAGLVIEKVEEPTSGVVPDLLGILATKPEGLPFE